MSVSRNHSRRGEFLDSWGFSSMCLRGEAVVRGPPAAGGFSLFCAAARVRLQNTMLSSTTRQPGAWERSLLFPPVRLKRRGRLEAFPQLLEGLSLSQAISASVEAVRLVSAAARRDDGETISPEATSTAGSRPACSNSSTFSSAACSLSTMMPTAPNAQCPLTLICMSEGRV